MAHVDFVHAAIVDFVGAHPVGDGLQDVFHVHRPQGWAPTKNPSRTGVGSHKKPIAHRGGLLQKCDHLDAAEDFKEPNHWLASKAACSHCGPWPSSVTTSKRAGGS